MITLRFYLFDNIICNILRLSPAEGELAAFWLPSHYRSVFTQGTSRLPQNVGTAANGPFGFWLLILLSDSLGFALETRITDDNTSNILT